MAKRLSGEQDPQGGTLVAVLGSGVVGALAYTFSDSFWFSAVEGEVYALSSLFTALVFWAILKWENVADRPDSTKWIILIAYLMGLSIGVHLLNLLAIPAIAMVYYFRNYAFSWKGLAITGAVSIALLGFVQEALIKGAVQLAGSFELFFVNDLGMGFNTGALVYLALLVALIVGLLVVSRQKGWWAVNTLTLGMAMVLLGYSSFATIMIRSAANPPMDENDPQNLFALLSYLSREQYGDRPLATGQFWDSPTNLDKPYLDGKPAWVKSYSVMKKRGPSEKRVKSFKGEYAAKQFVEANAGEKFYVVEEYVDSGEKRGTKPNYNPDYTMVFPRMYSSTASHIKEYKRWSNYKGFNATTSYVSPLVDGAMNRAQFVAHLEGEILSGQLEKPELERVLRRLFSDYGLRFDQNFGVQSKTALLVRNPETGQMNAAPLDNAQMRSSLATYFVDQLESGLDYGSAYVRRLDQQKRADEDALRRLTQRANQTRNQDDIRAALQAEGRLNNTLEELMPTQGENLTFFSDYQMGWMYFRYFFWNFIGKQNDVQGHGSFMDGNWLSGVSFIDAERLGNRDVLTQEALDNKGLNHFFYLPLILGLIGLAFQAFRDPQGASVVGMLFLMTGIAIVVYLNQTPLQPRERDYAYVGSFYAFAMWIGLGVMALYQASQKPEIQAHMRGLALPLVAGVVFYVMEMLTGGSHALSFSVLFMGVVATVLYAVSWGLGKSSLDGAVRAGALTLLAALVPFLMASEGWDDHSRARRRTGVDMAKNYLNSLAPNAVLFTNGDNDTFPLVVRPRGGGHPDRRPGVQLEPAQHRLVHRPNAPPRLRERAFADFDGRGEVPPGHAGRGVDRPQLRAHRPSGSHELHAGRRQPPAVPRPKRLLPPPWKHLHGARGFGGGGRLRAGERPRSQAAQGPNPMDPDQRQREHPVVRDQEPLRGVEHDRQQPMGASDLLRRDHRAGELPRLAGPLPLGRVGLPLGAVQVAQERQPQHPRGDRHRHHVRQRDGQVGVGQHGRRRARHLHG